MNDQYPREMNILDVEDQSDSRETSRSPTQHVFAHLEGYGIPLYVSSNLQPTEYSDTERQRTLNMLLRDGVSEQDAAIMADGMVERVTQQQLMRISHMITVMTMSHDTSYHQKSLQSVEDALLQAILYDEDELSAWIDPILTLRGTISPEELEFAKKQRLGELLKSRHHNAQVPAKDVSTTERPRQEFTAEDHIKDAYTMIGLDSDNQQSDTDSKTAIVSYIMHHLMTPSIMSKESKEQFVVRQTTGILSDDEITSLLAHIDARDLW